jgi:tellurite resistance protein TerC
LTRRWYPIAEDYKGPRFWVRVDGRWHATPLFLVLLVVESTDVLFALDSIPAIFAITRDPFIVYTSNIFAVLGLRAMYFVLAKLLARIRYLHVGLALVLAFVGMKMLLDDWLEPHFASWGLEQQNVILGCLAVIGLLLAGAAAASVIVPPKEPSADKKTPGMSPGAH